ncbi:MAG TPA: DUF1365 domain-containing protein [Streptosporangiaceae bacterium]
MKARIYEVMISHARSAPLRNVFRYRGYLWLVDLDHLPRVRLLAGFRARDHLGDPRASIRANLDRFLAANGIARPHTITMLTQARVWGYVFNPLTVYWCHQPECVVAEVHNTYGQRYAYLLHPDTRGRARVPKQFYVSPFYPVDGDYRMSLPEPGANPGDKLALSVRLDRPDGHSFAASVRGRAVPVTARARLKTAVRYPWSTAAVSARIRWQGVRLYLRGLPVIPRPAHQAQEGVQ